MPTTDFIAFEVPKQVRRDLLERRFSGRRSHVFDSVDTGVGDCPEIGSRIVTIFEQPTNLPQTVVEYKSLCHKGVTISSPEKATLPNADTKTPKPWHTLGASPALHACQCMGCTSVLWPRQLDAHGFYLRVAPAARPPGQCLPRLRCMHTLGDQVNTAPLHGGHHSSARVDEALDAASKEATAFRFSQSAC